MYEYKDVAEVNYRVLLAAHTTSASWNDVRLMCNILGVENSWKNMQPSSLSTFVNTTLEVCERSKSSAASLVYSTSETSKIENFAGIAQYPTMPAGTDVGTFRIKDSRQPLKSTLARFLTMCFASGCVISACCGQRRRNLINLRNIPNFGISIPTNVPERVKRWSHRVHLKFGVALPRNTSSPTRRYTTYVGDGDSSSFKRLSTSDPYNSIEIVRKEECLGHTQKRLKKKLKKASTNELISGPLHASKVERVGHLYALVVVQNRGKTPLQIHNALYVLLDHLVEEHDNCPFAIDSWCYYRKHASLMAEDPTVLPIVRRDPYLSPSELPRVHDVFLKFASIDMCKTLTLGQTQNANESLHSIVWHNAPKFKRVGQKSLQAVSSFNEGTMVLALVLAGLGISCNYNTLLHFARMDLERNRCKHKAVNATQKRRRRALKSQFLAAETDRRKREKYTSSQYKSGAFGSESGSSSHKVTQSTAEDSDDSDVVCGECKARVCPIGRKKKFDDWVYCEFCDRWYHSRCMGVNLKELGDTPFICVDCEDEW